MVKVEVGVDHQVNFFRLVPDECELSRHSLLRGLFRQLEGKDLIHMVKVETGVVKHKTVGMFNQNAIDGESDRGSDIDVPQHLRPVNHEASVIQQVYLGVRHELSLL